MEEGGTLGKEKLPSSPYPYSELTHRVAFSPSTIPSRPISRPLVTVEVEGGPDPPPAMTSTGEPSCTVVSWTSSPRTKHLK